MPNLKFNFSKKNKPKEMEETGVPMIVSYHSSLNCLSKTIRGNLIYRIWMTKLKRYFLQNQWYLVRVKTFSIESSVGSFKCGKKCCEVYKNVKLKTLLLQLHKIQMRSITTVTISASFTLRLKKCFKGVDYVRKILRWESCIQQDLFKYFQSQRYTMKHWFHRGCLYNINRQDRPFHFYQARGDKHLKPFLPMALTLRKVSSVLDYIMHFFPDFSFIFFMSGCLYLDCDLMI